MIYHFRAASVAPRLVRSKLLRGALAASRGARFPPRQPCPSWNNSNHAFGPSSKHLMSFFVDGVVVWFSQISSRTRPPPLPHQRSPCSYDVHLRTFGFTTTISVRVFVIYQSRPTIARFSPANAVCHSQTMLLRSSQTELVVRAVGDASFDSPASF
jgi:hypothetical protein